MLNNGGTRISFWPRFTFSHIHNVILASQKVIRVAEMEALLRDHWTTKMSETSFTHVKLSSETEAMGFPLNFFYLLPSLHPLQSAPILTSVSGGPSTTWTIAMLLPPDPSLESCRRPHHRCRRSDPRPSHSKAWS